MNIEERKGFEKDVEAFLPEGAWWEDLIAILLEDEDFEKAFNREQRTVLLAVFKRIVAMLRWHREEDEEPHKMIATIDAKLRNHRHELDKSYSAKPEF